jgi:hypothetical protein
MKKGNIMTVQVSRRSVLIGGMAVLETALPAPAMALKLHDLDSKPEKLNKGKNPWIQSQPKTERRFSTKTVAKDSPSFSHMAGR